MACGHAKFTGEVGRLPGHLGAGRDPPAERPLRRQARPPAGGRHRRPAGPRALGGDYQQEVDLPTLFKDVAHEYVQMATVRPGPAPRRPGRPHRAGRAHRRPASSSPRRAGARGRRGAPHEHGTITPAIGYTRRGGPAEEDSRRPPRCSTPASGGDPGRRRGAGRDRGGDRRGRALGAGVAKALLGKAAVPDDLPFVTGSIGLLGTTPSWD